MYGVVPDFNQRIYLARRIAVLVELLSQEGVNAIEVLDGTGLEPADLDQPSTRISYRQTITAFENVMRLSRTPTVALLAGNRMHVTAYGAYGYALLSSPTMESAIEFGARYSIVVGGVINPVPIRANGRIVRQIEVVITQDAESDLYRFALEFGIATNLAMHRDLCGPSFRPSCVRLKYPAPTHADVYSKLFQCPVLFNEPANTIEYDATGLDKPLLLSDPVAHANAREVCDQLVERISRQENVARQVRRALLRTPGHFPDLVEIAQSLFKSPRQLRRRLEAEQLSYRQILDEVRGELAIKYLRETTMSNDEIAGRLGYSDSANFRHALKRWTGKVPSDFRGSVARGIAVSASR